MTTLKLGLMKWGYLLLLIQPTKQCFGYCSFHWLLRWWTGERIWFKALGAEEVINLDHCVCCCRCHPESRPAIVPLSTYSHQNPKSKPGWSSRVEDGHTWRMNLKEDTLLSYNEKYDKHNLIIYSQQFDSYFLNEVSISLGEICTC